MKLPFSDEEYKKKKESHEILVPGDLCYCASPYNPLDGWMVVIEGNYMDLHSNMYPYDKVADIYQLNQYAGFSYHNDFKNDCDIMIVEEGAWYYRHDLTYIRHLNKIEYGTIKTLAETGEEVSKEIADAIFTVKKEYLDKYIKQIKSPTHDENKPKQILNTHEITPIATTKRPKKIKLKKVESKVKKEEPEEPKKIIRPLYGPGDLVHLKDDDKHNLYIVLGSEVYLSSSIGSVYPNIRYPFFHTYFVMNTNTNICSYTVGSNMVLYEQHFSQIALKEYYNRFLEEKI